MDNLQRLEAMSELSAKMLAAAQANDWDRLVALEKDVTSQRRALEAAGESIFATIPAAERAKAEQFVRSIIDNDARTREILDPWLDSVRTLLSRGARKRDLRKSYGAFTQAP